MTNAEKYPNIAQLARTIKGTGNTQELMSMLKKYIYQSNDEKNIGSEGSFL